MEDDEVKEPTQALSPVLDSTKGRKFIKNFKHKKRKSQLRLEDEFAQDIAFNLETLEQDSAWSGINLRNAEIGKPEVNFETASGKKHTVNKMSSELANELFSDFFGPNIDSKRENKFNFLTKTKLSHTSEKMTNLQSDRNFTGFRQDECMESKKKSRKLQQFIRNINKSLVIKYHEKFKAKYDFSQDRKRRKLNDYKKVLEEPIESVDLYKSFDNKAQKSKMYQINVLMEWKRNWIKQV
ncbi:hypothetical protein HHI36_020622 [Cryptolaemus montrouzieri]|uniref:Uncharacterized protein n=1 Tax=Cryptolaemus montrouzieri TaxID=559131 RepID=A0ABD2NBV9_9CUCU